MVPDSFWFDSTQSPFDDQILSVSSLQELQVQGCGSPSHLLPALSFGTAPPQLLSHSRRSLGTFGREQMARNIRNGSSLIPRPVSSSWGLRMSGMLVASFLGISGMLESWVWLPLSFAPCKEDIIVLDKEVQVWLLSCSQLVFGCVTSDSNDWLPVALCHHCWLPDYSMSVPSTHMYQLTCVLGMGERFSCLVHDMTSSTHLGMQEQST